MKFLRTILGLSLCAATLLATLVTSLIGLVYGGSGGYYAYDDITCSSQIAADCAAVTALAQGLELTFSDGGVTTTGAIQSSIRRIRRILPQA